MTVSENEYLQKLGNRIVKIREKKNLKQYELSDLLDIDVRVLRRIEKGKTNVQILLLVEIAMVLDIELNSLIKP